MMYVEITQQDSICRARAFAYNHHTQNHGDSPDLLEQEIISYSVINR